MKNDIEALDEKIKLLKDKIYENKSEINQETQHKISSLNEK